MLLVIENSCWDSLVRVKVNILPAEVIQVLLAVKSVCTGLPVTDCKVAKMVRSSRLSGVDNEC